MQTEVVPFTWEIHNRSQESQLVFQSLERLCHCALCQLVGGSLRQSKLGRGPLEQMIENLLKKI